jgi:hypothetical protein
MFSIKSAVLTALQTATALSTLQGQKIYFFHPTDFTNLPVASYFELDNTGSLYADDQEIGSEFIYQIDLWGKSSLTALAQAVDTIMIGLNFNRIASRDLYESDTKILHKLMQFRLDYSDPNF